jgi:glycosyltransferase involved in cell wall biosynthesis
MGALPNAERSGKDVAVKVSVLIKAYNHEKFIAQAVESAACQQTDFPYEIVVGEDCSTDGTRAVLRELGDRYPDKIRLFLRERNLGALRNFAETFKECRGDYVAWLDGDDYWKSPSKLQTQVNFLDAHPAYSSCAHNAIVFDEVTRQFGPNLHGDSPPKTYALPELLRGSLVPASSFMFRRKLLGELPAWYDALPIGDWPLQILCVQHGPMGYDPGVMLVYRRHGGGMWSGQSSIACHRANIEIYRRLRAELNPAYGKLIDRRWARQHLELAMDYEKEGDCVQARRHFRKALDIGNWHPRLLTHAKTLKLTMRLLTRRLRKRPD